MFGIILVYGVRARDSGNKEKKGPNVSIRAGVCVCPPVSEECPCNHTDAHLVNEPRGRGETV